jgi:hypothetical protein
MRIFVLAIIALLAASCGLQPDLNPFNTVTGTNKTITLNITIDPGYGYDLTAAPEVKWFSNNVLELAEYGTRYSPIRVTHEVKYNTTNIPTYYAQVLTRNGYGTVMNTYTANFNLTAGSNSAVVKTY